jgi:adenylyl-sulfate kinase
MTGLSGSGKSTLAEKLKKNFPDYVLLDGDVVRKGLCSDLRFSDTDRKENMRRLIELCRLFNTNGKNVITAFISPFEEERVKAKNSIENCYIIHVNTSLEECEKRDVKGLYKKARAGIIPNFTGIDSPFEKPVLCDLEINTDISLENSYEKLVSFVDRVKKTNIVCIDFDGVINNYKGYKGVGIFEEPIKGVSENMKKLKKHGWKIIIYTTRNETLDIENYLKKHDIPFDEININSEQFPHTNRGKPYADVYVDDRGITFKGKWDDTFREIINFKTWQGR